LFANDNHQQLRMGPVRSPAELEGLWAIDSAAYGEASITYEKFQDWRSSFPPRLAGFVFSKPRNGGYRHLAAVKSVLAFAKAAQLKESQLVGRTMRSYVTRTIFWPWSGLYFGHALELFPHI
jgi:hypothetical protein